jgi:hypothetical protein
MLWASKLCFSICIWFVDGEGLLLKTCCVKIGGSCDSVAEGLNLPGCDMGFFVLRVKPFKSFGLLDPEAEGTGSGDTDPKDMVSHL